MKVLWRWLWVLSSQSPWRGLQSRRRVSKEPQRTGGGPKVEAGGAGEARTLLLLDRGVVEALFGVVRSLVLV